MPSLDLTPPTQPLRVRAGDSPQFTFIQWADATKTVGEDLSAYTSFGGSIVSPDGDVSPITVDSSRASEGILTVTLDGTTTATWFGHGYRWDLHALTADSRPVTLVAGPVSIQADD